MSLDTVGVPRDPDLRVLHPFPSGLRGADTLRYRVQRGDGTPSFLSLVLFHPESRPHGTGTFPVRPQSLETFLHPTGRPTPTLLVVSTSRLGWSLRGSPESSVSTDCGWNLSRLCGPGPTVTLCLSSVPLPRSCPHTHHVDPSGRTHTVSYSDSSRPFSRLICPHT